MMNVVVGNSIKIETQLNMSAERFRSRLFNCQQWSAFLFTSVNAPQPKQPPAPNSFSYLGKNRLIMEDQDMSVDTIIVHGTDSVTVLQIVVDVYCQDIDLNALINNIIDNSDYHTQKPID
ncbi:hypothetical protein [Marinicella meishanensis]|uniref:hypothetical protein n=1 Tax=Marinicella meishanensis TaxID=2873263 RepID=UPI001CBC07ED|nr:hypothetical protein [Marinicella sp. NBU2979]